MKSAVTVDLGSYYRFIDTYEWQNGSKNKQLGGPIHNQSYFEKESISYHEKLETPKIPVSKLRIEVHLFTLKSLSWCISILALLKSLDWPSIYYSLSMVVTMSCKRIRLNFCKKMDNIILYIFLNIYWYGITLDNYTLYDKILGNARISNHT